MNSIPMYKLVYFSDFPSCCGLDIMLEATVFRYIGATLLGDYT